MFTMIHCPALVQHLFETVSKLTQLHQCHYQFTLLLNTLPIKRPAQCHFTNLQLSPFTPLFPPLFTKPQREVCSTLHTDADTCPRWGGGGGGGGGVRVGVSLRQEGMVLPESTRARRRVQ